MSVTGHAIFFGVDGIQVDGSKIDVGSEPLTVSEIAAVSQGNTIVLGSQIVHIPFPSAVPAITIASHRTTAVSDEVAVDGGIVTREGTPVTISGTPVSIDSSSHSCFGDESYQLPVAFLSPITILPARAVVVPLSKGVSINGTTLTTGDSQVTISETALYIDS